MKTEHNFVAINSVDGREDYNPNFVELLGSRAHVIDREHGFKNKHALKPKDGERSCLIVSLWETDEQFKTWTGSPEFLDRDKRGYVNLAKAKDEGKEAR